MWDHVIGPEEGIMVGLSLIVTVLGFFDPGPAGGRRGGFSTGGGVVHGRDFGGVFSLGFGFMAFAT